MAGFWGVLKWLQNFGRPVDDLIDKIQTVDPTWIVPTGPVSLTLPPVWAIS